MSPGPGGESERAPDSSLVYDGFISYSHAADGLLAPRLQASLQRFARPWWRRRAVRIFRDETTLSANPHLWSSITRALDESAWFILLLSPDATDSAWVNREIQYWVAHKDRERILPVVTDGEFEWDGHDVAGSAVPERLRGLFSEEPRWVDLRFARDEEQLDLKNPGFLAATADIASALRGIPKDELESEEVRQHRRTMRTVFSGALALLVLSVAAIAGWIFALDQRDAARRERDALALSQMVNRSLDEADRDLDLALLLAVEAYRHDTGPESTRALLNALSLVSPGVTVFGEPAHSGAPKPEFCHSSTPRPGVFVSVSGGLGEGEGEAVVFNANTGDTETRLDVPFTCGAGLLSDGRLLGIAPSSDLPSPVLVSSAGEVTRFPPEVRRVFTQFDDGRLLAEWVDNEAPEEAGELVVIDAENGQLIEETGVFTLGLQVDQLEQRGVTQRLTPPGDEAGEATSVRTIVDLTTYEETPLEAAPEGVYLWNADGSELLAFVGEEVWRFDLSGQLTDRVQLGTEGGAPRLFSFSPDGTVLALATSAGVELVSYPGFELLVDPIPHEQQLSGISMIDNRTVATQDVEGVVRVISESASHPLVHRVEFGAFNDTLFMLSPEYGEVWLGDSNDDYPVDLLPVDLSTAEIFDPYSEFGIQASDYSVPMRDGRWVVMSEASSTLVASSGDVLVRVPRTSDQVGMAFSYEGGRWARWVDALGADEQPTKVQITSLNVIEEEVTTRTIDVSGWEGRPNTGEAGFWVQLESGDIEVYDWSGEITGAVDGKLRFGSTLSQDGSRLAIVESDRSVVVHEVSSGEVVAELPADSHNEAPLFVGPERLVVRSVTGDVRLWDVSTARSLGVLAEAPSWPPSLEFGTGGYTPMLGRDGKSFWFTQPGEFVRITADPASWIKSACSAAGRSLTLSEWEKLVPLDEPYRDACAG